MKYKKVELSYMELWDIYWSLQSTYRRALERKADYEVLRTLDDLRGKIKREVFESHKSGKFYKKAKT